MSHDHQNAVALHLFIPAWAICAWLHSRVSSVNWFHLNDEEASDKDCTAFNFNEGPSFLQLHCLLLLPLLPLPHVENVDEYFSREFEIWTRQRQYNGRTLIERLVKCPILLSSDLTTTFPWALPQMTSAALANCCITNPLLIYPKVNVLHLCFLLDVIYARDPFTPRLKLIGFSHRGEHIKIPNPEGTLPVCPPRTKLT